MGAAGSGFLVPGLDVCRVSERALKAMGALGMHHPGFEKLSGHARAEARVYT